MDNLVPRPNSVDYLSLLNGEETALYQKATNYNARFYKIVEIRDPAKRERQLHRYYDHICNMLNQVRQTGNPALILAVEYAMLLHDEWHLKKLGRRDGVNRFLQTDITGNRKGIDAVGAALRALDFQAENSEIYHRIVEIGAPQKTFDAQHLVVDAVRDATKTQAARLRLDRRGLNQTELERMKSGFLEKRHENLTICENIYKTLQKEAKQKRDLGEV